MAFLCNLLSIFSVDSGNPTASAAASISRKSFSEIDKIRTTMSAQGDETTDVTTRRRDQQETISQSSCELLSWLGGGQ